MSPPVVLAPLGAIFIVIAASSAAAVRLLSRLAPSASASSSLALSFQSTALRAAVIFAPMILAAIGCVALAFPNPFMGCHCAQHGLHHPHLCLHHPTFALPLVAPAAYILGGWTLLVAPRLLHLAREVIASTRWAQRVRRLPLQRAFGVTFQLVDGGSRSAFTVGVLSPAIVFDRLLWDALSAEERRAVLHHEQGHVERRDGLTLLILRLCITLYPLPMGPGLLDGWRVAAESACDFHAAAKLGNVEAIAGALVAVEKVRAKSRAEALDQAPGLGVAAGGDLERRVIALLNHGENVEDDALLGNDVLATSLIALGAGVLSLVWPGGSFHHAVETLIGWFIH